MIRRLASLAAVLPALLLPAQAPAQDLDLSSYSGEELYQRFCASCHGRQGYGDGPAAEALRVMVPDLTRLYRRHGNRFPEDQVRRSIVGSNELPAHGSRFMPVWGYEFAAGLGGDEPAQQAAEAVIAKLLRHLRDIQQ
jgi:mono/diheme cytochrome c family protein